MTRLAHQAPIAGRALVAWTLFAVTAGLVVMALWLGLQVAGLRTENAGLETQRELAEVAFKTAQTQLKERSLVAENMINELGRQLREKEDLSRLKVAALAPPAGGAPEASAVVVWDPARRIGLLTAAKLPTNDGDHDYQIWITDSASVRPVNGGVFHVNSDLRVVLTFKPAQTVTQAAAFAISLEKKGGGPQAGGPIVLESK